MSTKKERAINIISIIANTLDDKVDRKTIVKHIEELLVKSKFNIEDYSQEQIQKFEEVALFALVHFMRESKMLSDETATTPKDTNPENK